MNRPSSLLELSALFDRPPVFPDNPGAAKYAKDTVMDSRYFRAPAAVVFPTSAAEVSALMRWAYEHEVPVTPRGAGSGLAGGAIAVDGGVVCSFEHMNRILEIDKANGMAVVEPGVITRDLDRALEPTGLFFAGYPMSEDTCFIGGNVAENAGGGRAVKYGVTGNYVLGAEVVLPTSEVLQLGGKRLKDVAGYNLLQLLVGSEGTLGLFTKIILRLVPRPKARSAVLFGFPSSERAADAAGRVRAEASQIPCSIEYIDGPTAKQTAESIPSARVVDLPSDCAAVLLVEFDGTSESETRALCAEASRILTECGGAALAKPNGGADVWALRKAVPWWTKQTGGEFITLEDVVVPPTRIPELVAFTQELRTRFGIYIALFGHAGDGNFHLTPMKPADMDPDTWYGLADRFVPELYAVVKDLGGSISGEHGIGRKRARFLEAAVGTAEYTTMRAIKRALDPKNLLNPGVIFPQ